MEQEIKLSDELQAKVESDRKRFDELAELAKPLQEYIAKYHDPMCYIVVEDDRVSVVRKEIGVVTGLITEDLEYIDEED